MKRQLILALAALALSATAHATNNHDPKPEPTPSARADSASVAASVSSSQSRASAESASKSSSSATQSTSVKTGDAVSLSAAEGGHSDSSSYSSGGNADASSDNDTTVTVEGDSYEEPSNIKFRAAPALGISSVQATSPCRIPVNAGFSGVGFGVGTGVTSEDEECTLRETVRIASAIGQDNIAAVLLCSSGVIAKHMTPEQCGSLVLHANEGPSAEAVKLVEVANERVRRAEAAARGTK